MNTGASKFIIKLKSELIKYDLPKYNIVTSKKDIHLLSENSQIIGRLDGVAYYKMTIENFLNLLFLWKGIRVKSPKVLNNVNFFYSNKVINKYLNRYNKLILKKSNKIIFQSLLSFNMHKKFVNFENNNYKIIFNGAKKNFKNNYNLTKQISFVITSNFRPVKRLRDALILINKLKKKIPNVNLHVIGKIDSITASSILNIDHSSIIYHNELKENEMFEIYKKSFIGISTSIFDPCPNSAIEMLSCGLPVISTSLSGINEILDYDKDFIIDEDLNLKYYEVQTPKKIPEINYDDWIDKIINILDNYENMKKKCKYYFEKNIEIEKIARKYADFIAS